MDTVKLLTFPPEEAGNTNTIMFLLVVKSWKITHSSDYDIAITKFRKFDVKRQIRRELNFRLLPVVIPTRFDCTLPLATHHLSGEVEVLGCSDSPSSPFPRSTHNDSESSIHLPLSSYTNWRVRGRGDESRSYFGLMLRREAEASRRNLSAANYFLTGKRG